MLQAYHSVVYSLACYTQVDSVPVTCLRLCAALPVSANLIDCERCAPGLTAHRDDNEMECRRPPGLRRSQRSSPPGSSGGVGSPASGGSGQLRPSGGRSTSQAARLAVQPRRGGMGGLAKLVWHPEIHPKSRSRGRNFPKIQKLLKIEKFEKSRF